MLDYILETLFFIWEAPYRLLAIGAIIGLFYCASLLIVGFPISVWETVTKKKVNEALEKRFIIAVTILLIIGAIILELHQKTH